jgi:hypothetical protein
VSAPRKRGLGQGKGSQSAHESGVQTKRAVKLAHWDRFDRLPGKGNSDRVRWALSMLETFGVLPE